MKSLLVATLLSLSASCAAKTPVPVEPVARRAGPTTLGDAPSPSELAPSCGNTAEGFEGWVASYRVHAIGLGISPDLVASALGNVSYDRNAITLDRSQKAHKRSFEEFSRAHITVARVRRGKRLLVERADLLAKLTARFGVVKEIIVAIWGLETDYGVSQGSTPSLQALATLAYDCRRAELFRGELLSALRVVERGDLSVDTMLGAWAGEVGQTQFLPSSYERFGIDFDGDGRIDLVHSTEDALASTAHFLAEHGWRAGEGYAPGQPNFAVLSGWNKSEVYRKTIALLASKLVAP